MKIPENSLRIFLEKSNHLDPVIQKYTRMRSYAQENNFTEEEFNKMGDTIFMYLRSRYATSAFDAMKKLAHYGFFKSDLILTIPSEIQYVFWEVWDKKRKKIDKEIPLRGEEEN